MTRWVAIPLALALAACAGAPRRIERTVGGERRTGAFVSPFSYEHFVRAELARLRGDQAAAVEELEMARAGAADDPLLIARLALAREALGQREQVDRLLAEGVRAFPEAEAIAAARAQVAELRGDLDAAIEAWSRALELGREDGAVIELARVLRESGRAERADAVLEDAAAGGQSVVSLRARLALAIARSDGAAAGESALALLRASPGARADVIEAAQLALDDGHPTLALRLLERLPEDTAPLVLLRARVASREHGAAERQLLTWLPDGPAETVAAARAWLAIGRPERAIELAEEALADGAGHEAQSVMARAQASAGRPGVAASLVAPRAARDPSARSLLLQSLRAGGLDALADEVAASLPAPGVEREGDELAP